MVSATAPGILIRNLKIEHDATTQAIQDNFNNTLPDASNPLIILDPYRCNPLAALICIRTEVAAQVKVDIAGSDGVSDISFMYPKDGFAQNLFIPVAGLHANMDNIVTVIFNFSDQTTQMLEYTVTTSPLPVSSVLLPTRHEPNQFNYQKNISAMADGFTFIAPQSAYPVGIDSSSNIRWLLTGDYVNTEWSDIERLSNGNFLLSFGFFELREVDILGCCVRQTMLNSRMHHDWYELDNGQLLITTEDPGHPNNYVMDVTAVINYPESAENVSEFRLREVLDVSRPAVPNVNAQGATDEKDWFHNNRSIYDPSTDSVIISGRHQDTILSVVSSAGALDHKLAIDDINWIMGPHDNWADTYQSKLLTPLDSEGSIISDKAANLDFWNWGQHSVTLPVDQPAEAGLTDIIIFNNGNYRSYAAALQVPAAENYSECSRYRIDTNAMTIQRTWTFGHEMGSLRYGSYVGSVRDYDTTYLVNHGGICLDDAGINVGTHWGDPDNDGTVATINPTVCVYEVLKETREVIWAMEFSWQDYPYFIFYNFKAIRATMYPSAIYG